MDPTKILFKIGFEFQVTNNHFCPWAKGIRSFQKQAIFAAFNEGKKLWHLEIDGQDIEFVTEPFPCNDIKAIELCLNSISIACDVLVNIAKKNIEGYYAADACPFSISFCDWLNGYKSPKKQTQVLLLKSSDQTQAIKKLMDENTSAEGLIAAFKSNGIDINTETEIFKKIKNAPLDIPKSADFEVKFTPQITIQHHLSNTIPLIVSLFCNIKENMTVMTLSQLEKKILASLPNLNSAGSFNYRDSINGLLFLYALTCAQIPAEPDLKNAISEVVRWFEEYGQVDPKVNITFLSRRPFSSMWQALKEKPSGSFRDLYQERIIKKNPLFTQIVAKNFNFFNYAEEYYYNGTDTRLDLSFLKKELLHKEYGDKGLYKIAPDLISNRNLDFLLKNGILCTELIWMLNPNIFNDYLNIAIDSVDKPVNYQYFDPKEMKFASKESTVDALSPPWFLEDDNSMGAFTDEKLKTMNYNPEYGEAILEIRSFAEISALTGINHTTFLKLPTQLVPNVQKILPILTGDAVNKNFDTNIKNIKTINLAGMMKK
jgi:hypothetical protein